MICWANHSGAGWRWRPPIRRGSVDFLHCQICQIAEACDIGHFQGARASVDDTQGANAGSIIENERTASIEPNSGLIDNERVIGKSFVLECVRNNHRFTIVNHVGTKRGVARCLFHI